MRWRCQYSVGGGPSFGRRPHFFCTSSTTSEGGDVMVTYSDLIQIGILVVGIINLFLNSKKK